MKDDLFIDTNLWIYLYSEKGKGGKIRELVDEHFDNIVISTQVLGEFFHIITKKGFKDKSEAKEIIIEMAESFRVVPIKQSTVISAIDLHMRYEYSYWDSLIIASALENSCKTLFSEDLQSGQLIEKRLKIVSPF